MSPDARLMLRAGAILFAISLINGFLVHILSLRQQAVAAHIIGLLGALFLLSLGNVWPKLSHGPSSSRVGAALAIYGFAGGWLINFVAAVTGVFGVFPFSVARSEGRQVADFLISGGLLSLPLSSSVVP
jgi:hypothetical protein